MEQVAMRAGAIGTAAITSLAVADEEISIGAAGEYAHGIGRVDFLVVDLTRDALANVVERTDIQYPVPLPEQVSARWTSGASLVPGVAYRVFFHVYDRSGVNLVAYDRRDFTCTEEGDHR